MEIVSCRVFALVLAVALLLGGPVVSAQEAVLVPAEITGTIEVGTETITEVFINASTRDGGGFTARRMFTPNASAFTYDLTVNVPQGGSALYNVSFIFLKTTDGVFDEDRYGFPILRDVYVDETTPGLANFREPNVGQIEGTVTLTGSGQLRRIYIDVAPVGFAPFFTTDQPALTENQNAEPYSLPVAPGDVICTGRVVLVSGDQITLPSQTATVPPNGSARCDYEIATPEVGDIAGTMTVTGEQVADRYLITAGGAALRFWSQNQPNTTEPYVFSGLSVGDYGLTAQVDLNDGDDELVLPFAARLPAVGPLVVAGGATTIADFNACQAYANGNLVLRGTTGLADVVSGEIDIRGLFDLANPAANPARGGRASDQINPNNGQFDLVLTPGRWGDAEIELQLSRSDPQAYLDQLLTLRENVRVSESNPIALNACAENSLLDLDYNMGTVNVLLSVAGGGLLSEPQVSGLCTALDAAGERTLTNYAFTARGAPLGDVAQGRVSFSVPTSRCLSLSVQAVVDGTLASFGRIAVDVVGGDTTTIDIGGDDQPPVLTAVISPTVEEGTAASITAIADDRNRGNSDIVAMSVTFAGVATQAMIPDDGAFDEPLESASGTRTLPLGDYEVCVTATDAQDNTAETCGPMSVIPEVPTPLLCDINGDAQIDRLDVGAIMARRGQPANSPTDLADVNQDGLISINDGRFCVLRCTNARCAP